MGGYARRAGICTEYRRKQEWVAFDPPISTPVIRRFSPPGPAGWIRVHRALLDGWVAQARAAAGEGRARVFSG